MEKGKFLLIFIIILVINLVSASYNCSNDSTMTQDQDEIKLGEKETINGLGLGLVYADETAVFSRIIAEIIVDAKQVLLSNETSSEEVELLSGDYTISLINLTDNVAIIKVEGNSESITKAEWTTINDLKVFLVNTEGSYPGQGNVEIIVGIDKISLSNDKNPTQIVTINEKNYLLELFSGSDTDAGVIVKKCETGNIIEIQDPTEVNENLTTDNSTINNSSISENSTAINQSEQITNNQTSETNENSTKETENKDLENDSVLKGKFIYISILSIMVIVIIVIFLIIYTKIKNAH